MLQHKQLVGWGTVNGAPSAARRFVMPSLSDELPQLWAHLSGSATQILEHWQKDTFKEIPQVAARRSRAASRAWSILTG
jgi:hypothetical protein